MLLVGCAAPAPGGDAQAVVAMYEQRHASTARATPVDTLSDVLPNHFFREPGGTPVNVSSGTVIGPVLNVSAGVAYLVTGDQDPERVEYGHPDAEWRMAVATIQVDQSVGAVEAEQVRVVLPVDGGEDPSAFLRDVQAMGDVVAVLGPQGVHEADAAAYGLYWDGALLAPVAEDGSFSFDALGEDRSTFQGEIDTVEEILDQASQPTTIETVDPSDGVEIAVGT